MDALGQTVDGGELDKEDIDEWFEDEDSDTEWSDDSDRPIDPAEKYAISQLRVVRETKDYQLDYLQHALQPGREIIDISPTYQRRLRWPNRKRSLLIESLLLNIPVPPIFLFERDYNEYEVIDGRQRLDAISSFLSNDYALSGLEYWPELNRKRFRDLPTVLQKGLYRRSLPAIVLLAETERASRGTLDVRRVLFDRLNTGGIRLNPQELRNALYPGRFNALLIRLARSQPFTDIWGIPPYSEGEESSPPDSLARNVLYASLADAELVLRFFALRDAILHDKQGSLRVILDRYMAAQADIERAELKRMEGLFTRNLSRLNDVFGAETFRLKANGRLSRPLYDALMVALSSNQSLNIEVNSKAVRQALDRALGDDDSYEVLVGRGNTIGSVHERVELAVSILSAGSK
ncbi:uncharacterized protein DUF262 [Kribbella steppae]|uniref:Uncharacterized protein DUF262 n=1 Tax=Kribbella steppae TaxID=2512223 RepID=A0A4R2HAV4_9ACTN|nr:DUF262 domain-containing protein [Kribbella steppae]TCO24512.1 uncharacterized protein DUF262 [Kribbella steppae]